MKAGKSYVLDSKLMSYRKVTCQCQPCRGQLFNNFRRLFTKNHWHWLTYKDDLPSWGAFRNHLASVRMHDKPWFDKGMETQEKRWGTGATLVLKW